MNEWISVDDQLPPNGVYVLIAKFDHRPNIQMYFLKIAARYDQLWVDDKDGESINQKFCVITHWMFLPNFPKTNHLKEGID